MKIRAAIIGATGYTGLELIRLAENHSGITISAITSRAQAGKSLKELFGLSGKYAELVFEEPDVERIAERVEVVFLCVPSGKAQEMAANFLQKGVKVIDLSADFRFKDVKTYEGTYKITHSFPDLCKEAVYGLPEVFEEEVKKARLIANPGCYPTSILLPLIPLVKEDLVEVDSIIADSKSGTSGAGRKSENFYSFCEINEDFKAYKIASHRHNPEIEEKLSLLSGKKVKVIFTPHLLPVNRGIFSTIYVKPKASFDALYECLRNYYKEKPFVEVVEPGRVPTLSEIKGTNLCKISLFEDKQRGWVVITSVTDNLVKGASGQALQNFNLMFGFPEDQGLPKSPLFV